MKSRRLPRRPAALRLLLIAALAIVAMAPLPSSAATRPATETAVLAGGCFWGMEAVFESLHGVSEVTSGYSGGAKETASYDQVSTGSTGHAESVQIRFDPSKISYSQLLDVFFSVAIDPTEKDRQGPDEGSQYRSVIFYANGRQQHTAQRAIAALTRSKTFSAPIVTEVVPFHAFYPAEAYHQHFAERNPTYPYIVEFDAPKMAALHKRFPQLAKSVG